VDTLKIDRSFVFAMTGAPDGLALVSTIINLAHALNLKVVAEGVETEEQSRLLRLLNCDEMQASCSASRCRLRSSKQISWPRLRRDNRAYRHVDLPRHTQSSTALLKLMIHPHLCSFRNCACSRTKGCHDNPYLEI
jgi:EAL domain-containing protein (putative c-di-GMP-specific phosphodiesterase class I)